MRLKRLLLFIPAILALSCASESPGEGSGEYDARAIEQLDQLSLVIGEMQSTSFTLRTVDKQIRKEHDAYLLGPDKMYFHSVNSDTGERTGLWYNGQELSLYRYESMTYAEVEAAGNILDAIDLLSAEYNLEFPAGDFFYPTLTDDVLEFYDNLWYLGEVDIDGVSAIRIQASTEEELLSIWIDSETHLPVMMAIASRGSEQNDYEAVFSNWRIDPNLPEMLFEFDPPEGSSEVEFGPRK